MAGDCKQGPKKQVAKTKVFTQEFLQLLQEQMHQQVLRYALAIGGKIGGSYINGSFFETGDYHVWGTVAAVLLIGGTLVEDVLTGGGGIADDAASFYFAYKLAFGL